MQKYLKQGFTLLLSLLIIFCFSTSALAATLPQAGEDWSSRTVILYTNDVHGNAVQSESALGYAALAQLKAEYTAAGASVLLLDAGDAIQGTPLVALEQGANAIRLMNAAGYQAMTLGNHEFDYGQAQLAALAQSADFPFLAANITDAQGEMLFQDHIIFDLPTAKVGVFGLSTPETITSAHPSLVAGLQFSSAEALYATASEQVAILQAAGCDLIICLGHLGTDEGSAPNRSLDVLTHTAGIDLFLDGHSHSVIAGQKVGDALLSSTGTGFANIGIAIYDAADASLQSSLLASGEYSQQEPALAAMAAELQAAVEDELSQVVAKATVQLNGEREPGNRTEETNLGDFSADAVLWSARQSDPTVIAAILNGGGIRASIEAGDISLYNMKTVYPFDNQVAILTLRGAQLQEALAAATAAAPTASGAFPQVAGIEFCLNTSVPYQNGAQYGDTSYYAPADPESRVQILRIGGQAFDPEQSYTIATNDFLAAGGDSYAVFREAYLQNGYPTGVTLESALLQYATEALGGVIGQAYAAPQGRILQVAFQDVPLRSPELPAVALLQQAGIVFGISPESYAPDAALTYGQASAMLYRLAGAGTADDTLSAGYSWALDNGLLTTAEDGTLPAAAATVSREQLALLLQRFLDITQLSLPTTLQLPVLTDAAEISPFATAAVELACSSGLLLPDDNGCFAPQRAATRAEAAQALALLLQQGAPKTEAQEEMAA